MTFFRKLYLTDRVFVALGIIVFLFFLSYVIFPFFYIGIASLFLLFVGLGYDIWVLFKQQNVEIERMLAPVFSLHEKNKVRLHIVNKSKYQLRVKIIDELPFQLSERDFSISVVLDKESSEKIEYYVLAESRGEYVFGNMNCFIASYFGFALKREVTPSEKSIMVYPSVLLMKRQENLALKHPSFTQGDRAIKKTGKSYEFDQIKNYVEGDDTRNINWKASSTLNKLMVNHYEDERSQQVYSVIDKSRVMKMPFNGLTLVDYAINATLAFSNVVLKKQDKAGLITFSQKTDTVLKADKGAQHLKKIMYALYKEKYDYTEADYEALYATIRKNISNRSLIFLYTNFDSIHSLEQNMKILKMINKYHTLIVVFFENTELEVFSKERATSLLEIYQKTMGKKNSLEKALIVKELKMNGIIALKCAPEKLSSQTINRYLELKLNGVV